MFDPIKGDWPRGEREKRKPGRPKGRRDSQPRKSRGRMSLEERWARSDERKRQKGLESAPQSSVEVFDGRVESLPSPSTPSLPAVTDDQRVRLVEALDRHEVSEEMLV